LINLLRHFTGIGVIVGSVYYSFGIMKMPVLSGVFHIPSLLLVTGVTFGIALIMMDSYDLRRFFWFSLSFSSNQQQVAIQKSEQNFEKFVDIYAKEGGEGLKKYIEAMKMPRIWNIVATKLAINVPIHDIKDILEFQIQKVISSLNQDITTLKQLAALAPAIGMFGSVLGLVRLLADLKNFETLGTNMSLALLTTLYGIFLGNILLVPLIRAAEKRRGLYIKSHTNLLYWLDHVEQKKPAFYMKTRLRDLDVKNIT